MSSAPLNLTADELLVLFDWVAHENEVARLELDPAVRKVLWSLEAALEQVVPAVVAEDYRQQVAAAKARLTASEE